VTTPPDDELLDFSERAVDDMRRRANDFLSLMARRRSVRHFASRPVPREIIRACLAVANTAPSGANRQPWHFVAVSDPAVKRRIREAAEAEERDFYDRRAPEDWLEALRPLGTDAHKPFLETAPYLIAIFAQTQGVDDHGAPRKNYYVSESVGIATGLLIAALHNAGLACLTHTPAPMRFLNAVLERPRRERPFLLLVVGYPAPGCRVPKIAKKGLDEVATMVEDD
jgi:nitroreductase